MANEMVGQCNECREQFTPDKFHMALSCKCYICMPFILCDKCHLKEGALKVTGESPPPR